MVRFGFAGIFVGIGLLTVYGMKAHAVATSPADQISEGQKLFGKHCASCHGKDGMGTKRAPATVGANALPLDPPAGAKKRKAPFRTAKDVLDFIEKEMPLKKPGSLKPEEYEAILAFDLKANGIDLGNKTLTATTASELLLHR
jgi:mono/diheme cytochrome c family protein